MTDEQAARLRTLAEAERDALNALSDADPPVPLELRIAYDTAFDALLEAIDGEMLLALLDALDEARAERDAVLADWNALVKAIGSKTNGGAVGHAGRVVRERDDALALLRECRDDLEWWCNAQNFMPDDQAELITSIDAMLGGGDAP